MRPFRVSLNTMGVPGAAWLQRRVYRAVWSDPLRKIRTLESFAETESDGGAEIRAAVPFAGRTALRGHLERHAKDEERHAELFRRRAAELRADGAFGQDRDSANDRAFDLERTRDTKKTADGELDLHGSLAASPIDEVGEVQYVAKLHVAECKAAELFAIHSSLLADDPETKAVFDAILIDEKYHVGYIGQLLKDMRREGQAAEVKAALKAARGSRFLGAWKRLGVRSGAGFGRVTMLLFYFTVVLPFALLSKRSKLPTGWQNASDRADAKSIRAQY
jgi:rubrerythrin